MQPNYSVVSDGNVAPFGSCIDIPRENAMLVDVQSVDCEVDSGDLQTVGHDKPSTKTDSSFPDDLGLWADVT